MNTNYKDTITSFVCNTVLHHVFTSWIIETNQLLYYATDKHNPNWMTGGTWYNTYICKKYTDKCLNNLLEIQELTDIISCILLTNVKNRIHHFLTIEAAAAVILYHQIQQQKH